MASVSRFFSFFLFHHTCQNGKVLSKIWRVHVCVRVCLYLKKYFRRKWLELRGRFARWIRLRLQRVGTEIASADGFWTLSFYFYVCVFVYSLINIFVLDKASRSVNTFPR